MSKLHYTRASRWLVRSAIFIMLCFLLLQSRSVVYAVRYIASIDKRDDKYVSRPYYDVAVWINTHVQPGQRVALKDYGGHKYFINEEILLNSETYEYLQWLWGNTDHNNIMEEYNFYARRNFTYMVINKEHMGNTLPLILNEKKLHVVFVGQKKMIGRIEK